MFRNFVAVNNMASTYLYFMKKILDIFKMVDKDTGKLFGIFLG